MTDSRTAGAAALVAAACVVLVGARADAYPQWQLRGGTTRCNQCHVAPTGGGLLNDHGRRVVGSELSTFFGDGALLHGAAQLPSWLSVGADLRSVYEARDVQDPSGPNGALAPLQAEVQADLNGGGWSAYGTFGTRGDWWSADPVVPAQNYQPVAGAHVVSREHWLSWQPGQRGIYARGGRYFAPFGLQLAQTFAYVRRGLGLGDLQESYNVSAGYLQDAWELHLTGFAPDVLRHFGSQERGAGLHAEGRAFSGHAAFTADLRQVAQTGSQRWIAGASAKIRAPALRTILLAEADVVRFSVDGLAARGQAVALLGAEVAPARGLAIMAFVERMQEDLVARDAARNAGTLVLGWLPYAHFETQLVARVELPVGGQASRLLLAQLHYFL